MACNERLLQLLDERRVPYLVLPHAEAFTAQEVAHESHVTGRRLAKVVLVRESMTNFFLVVLPASEHLDFGVLRRMTGRKELSLGSEEDMRRLFPDCDAGTMPPFGGLYGLPMYVDACLRGQRDIWFQAGNHHEVVRMHFLDFEDIAGPFAGEFCLHRTVARQPA